MMGMAPTPGDVEFKDNFEAGNVPPSGFHHRDHLRLVFVYLCESDVETANLRMRVALKKFLKDNDVPPEKYHETLTCSWVQAVRHFMEKAESAASFEEFLAADDRLLNTDIMLSHYKRETLFSDKARREFVSPDVQVIPQHR